ncbi:carboxypeptidase-like regulatory domain-containing protein [Chitinophagaceae bacterium MMS25-I14]
MIYIRYTLLISCLLLCLTSGAQTLKGLVVDGENGKALWPVVVVNVRTQQSTYTDDNGEFTIPAESGDQVAFSYIGYKTLQFKMPPTLGISQQRIIMHQLSVQLKEYIVRPKNYTKYQIDSLERRSTYSRALARERGGAIASPVTFLAERLSKRSKQIFAFQKEYNHWENEKFIDTRYTPELVGALTNLSGDTLAHFMNTYPVPYDYARTATELEFKMWIRTNFREWMKKQQQLAADSAKKEEEVKK